MSGRGAISPIVRDGGMELSEGYVSRRGRPESKQIETVGGRVVEVIDVIGPSIPANPTGTGTGSDWGQANA